MNTIVSVLCSRCEIEKDPSEFYKGFKFCKSCHKLNTQRYKESHLESIIEYQRDYKIKNKDKFVKYRKDNAGRLKELTTNWKNRNGKRVRDNKNRYDRTRKLNDPNYKILCNIRSRISAEIINNRRGGSTVELLGCSIEFFKSYLESQFDENMTWKNYGSYWHIDHIVPCRAFDLTRIDEQKICFHYKNLQPLEAIKNIVKGDILPSGKRARHL